MNTKWSKWLAIAHWLEHGWNEPRVPFEKGVYRIRVQPKHRKRGGEIVYIGRAGTYAGNNTICARVGGFITACMGFETQHSGGNRFFDRSERSKRESPVHDLSVRDLEVSYTLDGDPECRECEEIQKEAKRLGKLPALNSEKRSGATCRRNGCRRAKRLWKAYEKW